MSKIVEHYAEKLKQDIQRLINDDSGNPEYAAQVADALYKLNQVYKNALEDGKEDSANAVRQRHLTPAANSIIEDIGNGISLDELAAMEDRYSSRISEATPQITIDSISEPTDFLILNMLYDHFSPDSAESLPLQTLITFITRGEYTAKKAADLRSFLKSEIAASLIIARIESTGDFSEINYLAKTNIAKSFGGFNLLRFFFENNPEEEIKNRILASLDEQIENKSGVLDSAVEQYVLEKQQKLGASQINSVDTSPPWAEDWTTTDLAYLPGPQL